jgi:uncharacterized protein
MRPMANRLASASSPYLLQHASNPVDWYPWGEDAFVRARTEQKPIFLSVGYSTCHWCHVMAHESFEDAGVAAVLNTHFVNIKVDREERPDVDRVYMLFVQATAGQSGWPMSVWLTPSLEPFYGGTYFPPERRFGRPAFLEVLQQIAAVWRDQREEVEASAASLTEKLREATHAGPPAAEGADVRVPPAAAVVAAVQPYRQTFDHRHGGFGGAPKFPRCAELSFLLRHHALTRDTDALEMALDTLRAIALGGVRDHVGGGFHRYAVDASWRVPHFEKMLYDQAQISLALLEASQASHDPFYASVAEDTLAYVRREMTTPEGGFASAEDADSVPAEDAGRARAQRLEGAFYLWALDEVADAVGPDLTPLVVSRFGLTPEGNAPDPQGEFRGRNVLFTARDLEDVARDTGRTLDETITGLRRARQRLFDARARRPRPALDDTVITAWNGLMVAAFARAARVLRGQSARAGEWLTVAERAAHFMRQTLWQEQTGRLYRRWRGGSAGTDAYAEDYACAVWGSLELLQTTGDPTWLAWALDLQERMDRDFWDEAGGGWFSTTGDDPSVLLRLKEEHDGAEPSPGSIAVQNLLWLAHLTGEPSATVRVERTLARFDDTAHAARAVPCMVGHLAAYHAGIRQIVIVGASDDPATQTLQFEVDRRFLPFAVVLPVDPTRTQDTLAAHLPFVGALTPRDGGPTAFVCRGFSCLSPASDPETLGRQLDGLEQ